MALRKAGRHSWCALRSSHCEGYPQSTTLTTAGNPSMLWQDSWKQYQHPGAVGMEFAGKDRWGCHGAYLILARGLKAGILIQGVVGYSQMPRAGEKNKQTQITETVRDTAGSAHGSL